MAIASVELGWVDRAGSVDAPINGDCIRQEALTISASTATLATAVSADEVSASLGACLCRIAADTACYVAVGKVPDPTLTASTTNSTARRYLAAGSELSLPISLGEKVAVKAA